jgi:plastocyanin
MTKGTGMSRKMIAKIVLASGALATVLSAGGVASSANLGHVVAVPGSSIASYATRTVVITKGSTSAFHNLDIAPHDVISDTGQFSSALVGVAKNAPINGTSSLPPGTYRFHCSLHPAMHGSLIVR